MLRRSLSFLAVALVLVVAIGCQPKDNANQNGANGDTNTTTAGGDGEQSEVEVALAKLDPADRAVAEKQKNCPVSDAALGSMGKPYKVSVEGRDVFLCCEGCESAIKNDPDKYLAKLPAE